MMYRGFTTATCSECSGNGAPIEVEVTSDAMLYPESPEQEKIGLAKSVFRALGFGRRKEPRPKATKSREVAREKHRKPLFGPEEKDGQ